jgi:YhcH/YjgK/YiaL family protein
MIIDSIENADFYAGLHPRLAQAFDVLKNKALARKKDGKYIVDGEKVYYTIARYRTKPLNQGKLEAHKKYIDIQVVLKGEELLGNVLINGLTTTEPYDKARDIEFFDQPEKITTAVLKRGLFCILFPSDAHMPCCHTTEPSDVTKLVIKVRLV